MVNTRKERILYYLAIALLAAVYIAGMYLDLTRDCAKYAYIAKEMVQTGNWFSLKIQGEPYLQKPQLLFWITAFSFKLLGTSNLAFKLPVLLYSLLGFYSVYRLGSLLYNKNTGKLAALVLAFSVVSVLYNMDIHTDIILQTNVAFALWMLFGFLKNESPAYLLGSGIALGLCMLTKGPFGLLVPLFAVCGYLISSKNFRSVFTLKWITIFVIVLLVASPALLVQYLEKGWSGLWFFFWENNVGRATGSYMGTTTDLTFYLHNLLYLFAPWTIFLFAGATLQIRKYFQHRLNTNETFVFWGTWLVFILLSISKSKLPNYIQVIIPFLAIITAKTWLDLMSGSVCMKWIKSQQIFIYVVWGFILVVTSFVFATTTIFIWATIAILGLITFFLIGKAENGILLKSLFTLVTIGFLMNFHVMPMMFDLQAQPNAAAIINKQIKPNERVYNYGVAALERKSAALLKMGDQRKTSFDKTPNEKHFFLNYELLFYCNMPVINIENELQRKVAATDSGAWIFADERGKTELLKLIPSYDTLIPLQHFDMRRSARFINPSKRSSAIEAMYLIHLP